MYICNKKTLTQLMNFLNRSNSFKKKSGNLFTISDIQGYCTRKRLPPYMGDFSIEVDNTIPGVKLYSILNKKKEINTELNFLINQKLNI